MKALALVVLLAGTAHADTIVPPLGWTIDHAVSKALGAQLKQVPHFGLASLTLANVDVYVAPEAGAVLTVTLVGASTQTERDAAARAAVDDLHATSQRAQLAGSGIVEDGWEEKVDPAAKLITATLKWRDTIGKTSSTARIAIVADGEHIVSVTGECFAADDADPKLVSACRDALATLDPGIEPAKRVALALPPAGTRPAPPVTRPMGSAQLPATMDDASRTPLPPMNVPQEGRAADRRPVYVGIGIVVLAAVFWWNRRRRARQQDKM